MNLQRALQELSISDGMNELAQSTNETNGTFSDVTVFAGSHDGFLSYLGSDVSHCTLKIANPVNVTVGTLVGVRRSDGRVTVARVDPALSTTPPGFVHVTLTSDGSWKDVPLNDLFSLPSAFGQVTSISWPSFFDREKLFCKLKNTDKVSTLHGFMTFSLGTDK